MSTYPFRLKREGAKRVPPGWSVLPRLIAD
jgi:hypothetical protein